MKIFTWLKGFFEADTTQSSKRLMGILSGIALIFVCMADILEAFTVHQWVAYTLAGYSAAALGISSVDSFKKGDHKGDAE